MTPSALMVPSYIHCKAVTAAGMIHSWKPHIWIPSETVLCGIHKGILWLRLASIPSTDRRESKPEHLYTAQALLPVYRGPQRL